MPIMRAPVKVMSEDLSRFLSAIFDRIGLPAEQSRVVVEQMIVTSLRGVDTHGIALFERVVQGIKEKQINIRPKIRLLRNNPSVALMDGDFGSGQYTAKKATALAIKKAAKSGIGAVSLTNLGHCGALSFYGLLITAKKMSGMIFTNSSPLSAPWGGTTPIFGTNPLCFVFPYRRTPIILDIATTTVAGMKLVLAAKDHTPIPMGWALDSEGRPTTDPNEALKGVLLQFGGYKGYGLMLMVELAVSIMSGGRPSYEVGQRYQQGGFYVQAIDIGAIRNYDEYLSDLDKLVSKIKSSKLAEGYGKIYLPGEPELITAEKRTREGIPVDPETWAYFTRIAEEYGITPPKKN